MGPIFPLLLLATPLAPGRTDRNPTGNTLGDHYMNNKLIEEARRIGGGEGAEWARVVPMDYEDACAVLRDTDKTGRFEWHDNPEGASTT